MNVLGIFVFVFPVALAAVGWIIALRVARQGDRYRAKARADTPDA
jgi:hypothetical protein